MHPEVQCLVDKIRESDPISAGKIVALLNYPQYKQYIEHILLSHDSECINPADVFELLNLITDFQTKN